MKEVRIAAGTIRYKECGEGPAIVFLHGTLSNSNTWRKITPILAERFRCIMPDLPLGGHSIPLDSAADLSPPGIAAMIKQFLDALGLDNVILVGNDTGGAYAQVFAAVHPESVAKLVLCNTDSLDIFPPKPFEPLQAAVRLPGLTGLMALLFRYKSFLKTSAALGLLSHTVSKHELHDLYVHAFIHQRGVRADFAKVVKGWSPQYTMQAAEQLKRFTKPVLVVWGADDVKLFPVELGKRVAAIFPDASFETVDHSLTYVQEDQPKIFAAKIERFITST